MLVLDVKVQLNWLIHCWFNEICLSAKRWHSFCIPRWSFDVFVCEVIKRSIQQCCPFVPAPSRTSIDGNRFAGYHHQFGRSVKPRPDILISVDATEFAGTNRKQTFERKTNYRREKNIFSNSVIIHFHEAIVDAAEASALGPGQIVSSKLLICE